MSAIPSLSLTPGLQYPEVGSSNGNQVELLTRLRNELKPGGVTEERYAIFSKLDPHVQFQAYQLLCIKVLNTSLPKEETINKGMDLFLRNPSALSSIIEDLLLYANSRVVPSRVVPSLEERTEVVTASLSGVLPRGILSLIGKYAMDRFDDQMFGFQQWIDCWGATPVTFTKSLMELRCLVNGKLTSGAKTEKPVDQMNEAECANFLKTQGIDVCREENLEPPEEMYECLNRRVRPQDKFLAGFTCVVTYIPQFVRKGDTILAVTARTLALNLGPNPTKGRVAKLQSPGSVFDAVLSPEDADRIQASCYFVMEQDVVPNTIKTKPSVLVAEFTGQGDKGWQLPEPRNFFATVFSRLAWKGQFLYGQNPSTYTYGQGKSRSGNFFRFGVFGEIGLDVLDSADYGYNYAGAAGSRKFLPPLAN